jgi:hypothetical protein
MLSGNDVMPLHSWMSRILRQVRRPMIIHF